MEELLGGTRITYLGHSAFRVVTAGGEQILIDPFLSQNPQTPENLKTVGECDTILLTHGHFDHMGDAVALASRLRPAWPCMHEMSLWLGRRLPGGADAIIGMNKGGTVEAAGLRVTMVRADHSAGDWHAEAGAPLYLGEPVGFIVELEDGLRIYHAGDTDVFGDMRLIAELHRPDLAFLPIGGHFTMGPRQAAMAVELLGVSTVVPIHYGTFPLLTGTPDELRAALRQRGLEDVRVISPEPGETVG